MPMIRIVFLAVAGTLWLATATEAQSTLHPPARSFEELMVWVRMDDPILVFEASGQETRGRVGMLSPTALTLVVDTTRRHFVEDDVTRVDRWRPDSTLNGLLIGAGAGAIAGNGLGRT